MKPLGGIKVIEFTGIGPGPFCGMMLSDMGAQVTRISRLGPADPVTLSSVLNRGRSNIELDLKSPAGLGAAFDLIDAADALIEGFRPGVMERLGLGPEVCLTRNPRLVYGRVTGWGQTGPLSQAAGHDLNYIALTGVLHAVGAPPLNLIGDFGGGGMLLAFGVVCALLEARATGKGQVVDAAMTDGSALLMSMIWGMRANNTWTIFNGSAHFYTAYKCSDGKFISVAAIEPQFYACLREKLNLADSAFDAQMDRNQWPQLKTRLAAIFSQHPRAHWEQVFSGSDACVAPVLDLDEAPQHPHNIARGTFIEVDGVTQPAPAPRFLKVQP
jgi:alpha-methylacyl-CoA racemase